MSPRALVTVAVPVPIEVAAQLCRLLGLDPDTVTEVTITAGQRPGAFTASATVLVDADPAE